MTAVRVPKLARFIVIFSKENGCVVSIIGILVKQLIHGSQESLRLFPSRRALAAKISLEICHQQSSSYALARDIANNQAESSLAEIKKVVIIASDGPSGIAKPSIGERLKRRMPLWEETRLYLLGNGQVARGLALGLKSTRRFVDLNKRVTVPIHIFEKGVPGLAPSPGRLRRREYKTDSALRPFFEERSHVFG